jgi:hypothetical protein
VIAEEVLGYEFLLEEKNFQLEETIHQVEPQHSTFYSFNRFLILFI